MPHCSGLISLYRDLGESVFNKPVHKIIIVRIFKHTQKTSLLTCPQSCWHQTHPGSARHDSLYRLRSWLHHTDRDRRIAPIPWQRQPSNLPMLFAWGLSTNEWLFTSTFLQRKWRGGRWHRSSRNLTLCLWCFLSADGQGSIVVIHGLNAYQYQVVLCLGIRLASYGSAAQY